MADMEQRSVRGGEAAAGDERGVQAVVGPAHLVELYRETCMLWTNVAAVIRDRAARNLFKREVLKATADLTRCLMLIEAAREGHEVKDAAELASLVSREVQEWLARCREDGLIQAEWHRRFRRPVEGVESALSVLLTSLESADETRRSGLEPGPLKAPP